VDEDGEEVPLDLGPPATEDEIAALEQRVGGSLPRELREVLAVTRSLEGPLDVIDFLGLSGGMEVPGIPAALELASRYDGPMLVEQRGRVAVMERRVGACVICVAMCASRGVCCEDLGEVRRRHLATVAVVGVPEAHLRFPDSLRRC